MPDETKVTITAGGETIETTMEGIERAADRLNNGYDPEAVNAFIDRIEALQAEIDLEAEQYKERCAPLRFDISVVKKEVKGAGINLNAFNAIVKRRRLEQKAARIDATLDMAELSFYREMTESLERLAAQLPGLGEAALERHRAGS